MVVCERVTVCCKGPPPTDAVSILRLKVHYGKWVMSLELPKLEVSSWITANLLFHRLSVSSVFSSGFFSRPHCLIHSSFLRLSVFHLNISTEQCYEVEVLHVLLV